MISGKICGEILVIGDGEISQSLVPRSFEMTMLDGSLHLEMTILTSSSLQFLRNRR
jgi:hypothetical protein